MKAFILVLTTTFLLGFNSYSISFEKNIKTEFFNPGVEDSLKIERDPSPELITSGYTLIGCGAVSFFSSRYTSITFITLGGASLATGYIIRSIKRKKNKRGAI